MFDGLLRSPVDDHLKKIVISLHTDIISRDITVTRPIMKDVTITKHRETHV